MTALAQVLGTIGGEPVVAIGAFALHSPASVATNVVLAAQGILATRVLGRRRVRGWPLFFLGMASATALGAIKHGVPWLEPEWLYQAVKGGSNLSVAIAVIGARRAVLPGLGWFSALCVSALVLANVATRDFSATALVLAVGLLPVVGVSVIRLARYASRWRPRIGLAESAWLCGDWGAFSLAGVVWAAGAGVSPWFDHTDVAHIFMMGALALVHRSALAGERSWSWTS